MRKTLASTGVVVLLAGLGVGVATTAGAAPQPSRPSTAEALARAQKAVADNPAAIRRGAKDAYQPTRILTDASGASHVRFARTYAGLPVLGGDFVVHNAPDGALASTTVAQSAPIAVATTAGQTAAAATTSAQKSFTGKATAATPPRLVVDATATPRLAYETVVVGMRPDGQTPSRLHVVTDAKTGAKIRTWDEIQDVAGTGNGIYVGQVTVDTTLSGSTYSMVDPTHGNGRTCDMNNRTSGTCTTFTDADNVWGNGLNSNRQSAGVDAHYGAAKTFDYFRTLGRNGIFNNGAGVPSRVHYGSNYQNAFWDGAQMTYGDGANNARPLISLDVSGHEMTHGVTESAAGLVYSGESGGLNEATSDIFGTMVEFYASNPNDPGDYLIGEEIDLFGNGQPLRYMVKPSNDGSSPDCWYSGIGNLDVHYSSGIGNKFYYMLAEGSSSAYGSAPTCGAPAVTGIGRDKAARIYYRALDVYFTSTTGYVRSGTNDARAATLSAATDLYGNCGVEYKAVQAAWTAAGVNGEDAACGGDPTTPPPGSTYTNDTDVAIPDAGAAVTSSIAVSRAGNAPATLAVGVNIVHTYRGDLVIDLLAPDGSAYRLKNSSGSDSADNVVATYTVNASSEAATGTWRLRVQDVYRADAGYLNSWSVTF